MSSRQATLADRVDSVIQASPYLTGRNLRFETEAGRVTLKGVVNTYFQKQMAQEALRKLDGVTAIENELEVSWA
ncbi:MAG TPA: BON domain-containing protein [Pirellulaceae bacterium]|nr:BON domain-containing protein [Pirellulaceae bacterium]